MSSMNRLVACIAVALTGCQGAVAFAVDQMHVFQSTLDTGIKDPVSLSVAVSSGNVSISYRRDDQLSVSVSGKDAGGKYLSEEYLKKNLVIERKDNHITVRDSLGVPSLLGSLNTIDYQIDVPYRTQVDSIVSGTGNQTVAGVFGPARLTSGVGNIEASYVRFAPLYAHTGKGNISCSRCFQVDASTDAGNINLTENGYSKAVVKSGRGKIDVSGARAGVDAEVDAGTLHIKAILWDDWQLKSSSGIIRIEVPAGAKFEVDASSESGEVSADREDMPKPQDEVHQLHQQVNGGGKHITARSSKGSIFIE